jgi:abhydrolase domain-containing protein 12
VFVHAENDTTMPWVETESLFKSTLQAAIGASSRQDDMPREVKVVDLGEAGRQEVWQSGSRCIQKTIAKHGGKRARSQHPGFSVSALAPGLHSLHHDDWLPSHSSRRNET